MTLTARSLFSGGEGVGIGFRASGVEVLPGIENDLQIAQVAEKNGFSVILSDILVIDPASIPPTDILHASPECTRASVANAKGGEAKLDIALARKICEFIEVQRPKYFTLENVYYYRRFHSWWLIADTLNRNGYWYDLAHVNAADFGVPQTRKRMIVRAIRGGWPKPLPSPEKWVGWYRAIEDLIPTLPGSQFADWQLDRLPDAVQTALVDSANSGAHARYKIRHVDAPAQTITTSSPPKAFLMSGNNTTSKVFRTADKPAQTITAARVGGDRAFITDSRNNRESIGGGMTIRDEGNPVFTIHASSAASKAWLSQGRVVSMTTRALTRFQSFPDSYQLPEKKTLAAKVIGNAVPPLLYQKIIQGLIS